MREIKAYNFEKVTDFLYRCSMPFIDDLQVFKDDYGVKTIIDFRIKSNPHEKKICHKIGLNYIRLPWSAHLYNVVNFRYYLRIAIKFVETIIDNDLQPILIHCMHGRERTGVMIGVYRLSFENMSVKAAVQEMKRFGFKPYLHFDLVLFLHHYKRLIDRYSLQEIIRITESI